MRVDVRSSRSSVGVGALVVAGFVSLMFWLHNPFAAAPRMVDLQVYVGAARQVLDGGALYDYQSPIGLPFTYPPIALAPFVPMALIPYTAAKALAFAWTWLSVGLIAWLVVRHAEVFRRDAIFGRAQRAGCFPVVFLVLAMSQPVQLNQLYGQISVLLVALIMLDVLVIVPRWPRFGGLLSGVAAAMKLTPLAILPFLWLAGRRRGAVNGVAMFGGLSVLGAAAFPGATLDYWLHQVGDMPRFGSFDTASNQSINGLLLSAGLRGSAETAVFGVLALTVLVIAWRGAARLYQDGREFAALVVVGCAMVAASPISWGHHQLWLLLAGGVVVSASTKRQVVWTLVFVALMIGNPVRHLTHGIVPPIDWLVGSIRGLAAIALVSYLAREATSRQTEAALAATG